MSSLHVIAPRPAVRSAPRPVAPPSLVGAREQVPDDAPPLALPGAHFAFATLAFVSGALGLALAAPEIAAGAFFAPKVLAVVHLFTLGWITTSILGALYQFLPVAIGAPIRSQSAAWATLGLHATGLARFVCGAVLDAPQVFRAGATLVAVALSCFAANLALSLARAKDRGLTFVALIAADVFLVATVVLGAVLAFALHTGALGAARPVVLAVHVHVAVVGWVLMVMVGVAHRLLPMFLLSHGARERPGMVAVAALAASATLLLASLIVPAVGVALHVVAGACALVGVAAFLVQALEFRRTRKKRVLDPGMRLAFAGLAGLALAGVLGPVALTRGYASPQLLAAYVFCLVVFAIATFVAGHYYKIVPFLVWYHRFGPLVGERQVPSVAELYSERAARAAVALVVAGEASILAAIALGQPMVLRLGAGLFTCGALIVATQMSLVARRRP